MVGSSGRKIVVEFIGDASSLKSGAQSGEAALTGFSSKAQAAGRIAGRVLAGGLLLAGAAAVKAGQAAAEDEAAQSQLAQQLRQAAHASDEQIASTEAWITAQGKALGITDDELRPALAKLATATGDVGEAQKLAALAMDVSAGTGKDLNQVTEALVKAQNGSIGGLSRLGIATKDAEGKTLSLTEVTQKMADKYNGAASKAAETTAGKQKILTTQFGELQEQIGAQLLPVLVKLSEVGLKVVNWISQNTTTVGILVGAFASLLAITTAVGFATKAFGAIQTVWAAITKSVAAAQWLLNAAMTANPIGLVVVAIAALVAGLILAYKHSETFRAIVDAAFGAIKTVIVTVIDFVVDFVKNHWKLLIAIIAGPLGIVVGLVITHWDKIKAFIGVAMAAIKDTVSTVWNAIVGAVRTVLSTYQAIIQAGWQAIKAVVGNQMSAIRTVVDNVWDAIKAGFGGVRDRLGEIAGGIKSTVSGAFEAIKAPIQGVIDKVQWLIDKIQALIDKLKSIPKVDVPFMRTSSGSSGGGGGALGGKDALAAAAGVTGAVAGLVSARGSSAAASQAPTELHVHFGLVGDPVAAAREFVRAVRQLERSTGRQLLVSRN